MAGLDLETKPWWVALIVGLVLGGGAIWASDRFLFKKLPPCAPPRSHAES